MLVLLIPFSFDFVDALCIAAVLGFLCENVDTLVSLGSAGRSASNKVAVSVPEGEGETQSGASLDYEDGLPTTTVTGSPVVTNWESNSKKTLRSKLPPLVGRDACIMRLPPLVGRDPCIMRISSAPTSPISDRGQGASRGPRHKYDILRHVHGRGVLENTQPQQQQKPGPLMRLTSWSSAPKYPSTAPGASSRDKVEAAAALPGANRVHWALALVAMLELVLSGINDQTQDDE